ncbi:MAG TPA: hypothetical protein VG757_02340 [Devosia sp.]|nr:hypothetical protein [Devosia sp.]
MKKLIPLLLASSMIAAVPAVVLGQAAAPAVSEALPSAEAGAMAGTQFTWTDLLASVNAQASGTAQTDWASLVGGITADSNVQIVDVFSLEGSPAQAEGDTTLQAALDTSGQSMTGLHTAISGNTALVDKLTAQGYSAADVVAITSNPDGSFLIYVKPVAGAAPAQ